MKNSPYKKPTYSLIICTYNQRESLGKVLGFLANQVVKDCSEIEILIVDNNSSDGTKELCKNILPTLPFNSRYIEEKKQGLSIARNRGTDEAVGGILIFTDDDAKIPDDWLQSIIDTYQKYDPDCVFGKIIIDWELGIPEWYCDAYESMFVGLNYGDDMLHIEDLRHEFYGKNFSLKKEALIRAGGFDENLGRKGDRLFIGEETKIYRSLIRSKCRVMYNPECIVFHMLKDVEYTLDNFKKRYHDANISEYYMLKTSTEKKLFGRPLYVLKILAAFSLKLPKLFFKTAFQPTPSNINHLNLETKKHFHLLRLWLFDRSA